MFCCSVGVALATAAFLSKGVLKGLQGSLGCFFELFGKDGLQTAWQEPEALFFPAQPFLLHRAVRESHKCLVFPLS